MPIKEFVDTMTALDADGKDAAWPKRREFNLEPIATLQQHGIVGKPLKMLMAFSRPGVAVHVAQEFFSSNWGPDAVKDFNDWAAKFSVWKFPEEKSPEMWGDVLCSGNGITPAYEEPKCHLRAVTVEPAAAGRYDIKVTGEGFLPPAVNIQIIDAASGALAFEKINAELDPRSTFRCGVASVADAPLKSGTYRVAAIVHVGSGEFVTINGDAQDKPITFTV